MWFGKSRGSRSERSTRPVAGSIRMKFQFSLRALIIACFIAGLFVWFGVRHYFESLESPELIQRWDALLPAVKTTFVSATGSSSASWNRQPSHWQMHVRGSMKKDEEVVVPFNVRLSCVRNGFSIQPIELEYDNSFGNDELIREFVAICTEREWRIVGRKVEKLND